MRRKKRDWEKWERRLREHRFWRPVLGFVLDDIDPKRPKYEIVRFLSPLFLLVLAGVGIAFAPGAATLIFVLVGAAVILLVGVLNNLVWFGLGRFAWFAGGALALSVVLRIVGVAWEPAQAMAGFAGLVFFLLMSFGYVAAGVRLVVLVFLKKTEN